MINTFNWIKSIKILLKELFQGSEVVRFKIITRAKDKIEQQIIKTVMIKNFFTM